VSLKLRINAPDNRETRLNIVVENMGRLNFGGHLLDTKVGFLECCTTTFISTVCKGLVSNVTLDGQLLVNWTMCISGNLFDQSPMLSSSTSANL
jgi:hypothetical protein